MTAAKETANLSQNQRKASVVFRQEDIFCHNRPCSARVCGCRISCGAAQHSARTRLGDLSCAAA